LSDIESQIRKTELKLSQLALKERKLKSTLYFYSIPTWFAFVAFSLGSSYFRSGGSGGGEEETSLIRLEEDWRRWILTGLGLVLSPVL
jgi:hypothetical protein